MVLKIFTLIKTNNVTITKLLENLKPINKDKIWQVIQFLQDENKIQIDALEVIRLT